MELQKLIREIAAGRREARTVLRAEYAKGARTLILRDAIAIAEGRSPTFGEIALAAARLDVLFGTFDRSLLETESRAVHDGWTSAMSRLGIDEDDDGYHQARASWNEEHGWSVRKTAMRPLIEKAPLPEEVRKELLGSMDGSPVSDNPAIVMSDWCRGLRDAIEQLDLPKTYVVNGARPSIDVATLLRLLREGVAITSCRTEFEQRMERIPTRPDDRSGEDDPATYLFSGQDLWELHRPHGATALLRAFDTLGVNPLEPSSTAFDWRGPRGNSVHWHLFAREGHVVLFAINVRDSVLSEAYALPGSLEDAINWISSFFRMREGRPVPLADAPTLADLLQVRSVVETHRSASALCERYWRERVGSA